MHQNHADLINNLPRVKETLPPYDNLNVPFKGGRHDRYRSRDSRQTKPYKISHVKKQMSFENRCSQIQDPYFRHRTVR